MKRLGKSTSNMPVYYPSLLNPKVFHVKNGILEFCTSLWQLPSMVITMSFRRLDAEVARAIAITGLLGITLIKFRTNGMWLIVALACEYIYEDD